MDAYKEGTRSIKFKDDAGGFTQEWNVYSEVSREDRKQIKELENRIENNKNIIKDKNSEIDGVDDEINTLRDKVNKINNDISKEESKIEKLTDSNRSLHRNIVDILKIVLAVS